MLGLKYVDICLLLRKKDKNAPKAALSAYIIFTTETRQKLLAANPEMKSTEIMKVVTN